MLFRSVRHGESEANISKRYCGITDVELSQLGFEQAKEAGKILKDKTIHNIFSSPLKRAKNTAIFLALSKNVVILQPQSAG